MRTRTRDIRAGLGIHKDTWRLRKVTLEHIGSEKLEIWRRKEKEEGKEMGEKVNTIRSDIVKYMDGEYSGTRKWDIRAGTRIHRDTWIRRKGNSRTHGH